MQCPSCAYSGNIDLTRLPEKGATIECPKCKAKLRVDRNGMIASSQKTITQRHDTAKTSNETAPVKASATAAEINVPSFHGTSKDLFGIFIINILLGIVTLGIYKFWGKTKIRRYLYSQTELMGERFAYHGTGKELFIGWIKAILLLFAGSMAISSLATHINRAFLFIVPLSAPFVIAFIVVASTRYRLSRSSWRGVRFSFRGSVRKAVLIYANGYFLVAVTLGLYIPFFHAKRKKFWLENAYYGNSTFEYNGNGWKILKTMYLSWILTLLTLGIYGFWFSAKLDCYDWANTRFESLFFESAETGQSLFALYLINILLIIFTIGLATPWVMTRTLKYKTERLITRGTIDFEKIKQDARTSETLGEGFADALNIDAGLI